MNVIPLQRPEPSTPPMLRVSDLRQWVYCPRVTWWTYVCPVEKLQTFKMRQGLAKEHRLQRLQKRRTLRAFELKIGHVESNRSFSSETLGLSGKLDMLIHSDAYHLPVEVKFTLGPARLNHRLQLAGYAFLLEEYYGLPVPYGYIVRLPDDTVEKIPIDAPLRELAWRTIHALRRTIEHEQMPPPNPTPNRCVDCEYRNFCGDIIYPK